jgi:hypothetical protein
LLITLSKGWSRVEKDQEVTKSFLDKNMEGDAKNALM